MSESSARSFRREKICNLSKSLIGNYICTKGEGGKLGFKTLKFIDEDGDEDSIKIKDIFSKDFIRIQNLFSVLDDLVAYDYSRFGVSGQLTGFWNRFKEENFYLPADNEADSASPTDMIKLNLSQCDQAIRLIYWVLGANEYIREKEEQSEKKGEKKYTFGSLLFDSNIDAFINSGRGRYDNENPSVKTVISVLLAERNKWAIHRKTADDSESSSNQNIATLLEECRNKTAIVLVALLHIVNYHYDALDSFFIDFFSKEENKKLLKEETINKVASFDPEVVKKDYAQSLLIASNDELKRNVGSVGNIANDESLKLMNLKMQLVWKDQAPVANSDDTEQENDFTQELTYLDLKHIHDADNRINVILGNPGSGKSTLLVKLQKELSTRWLDGELEAPFPISISLKGVGRENFVDSLRDSLGERLFSVVEPLCKAGGAIFILDGLNELPLRNPQNFLDSLCKTIRSEYAGCRFYISGRIHEFDEIAGRFQSLQECSIYQMRDISRDDIITYFKELKASEESKNTFLEWIQNADLSDLLASPLNFSMIAKMVLNQTDYAVPVESINNRGELLDLFLKSTLQDKGILTEGIDGESFKLLQILAVALDDNQNHPISRTLLSSYCKHLYPDSSAFEKDLILRQSLEEPCRLNVIKKTSDINGEELYSFTIDTFQEFFLARSFAVLFVGNRNQGELGKSLSDCISCDFNVRDVRRFEMLKLALELIAGGRIQRDTPEQDGIRFVEDFLRIYAGSLGTLAELSSSLALSSKARTIVEQEVLELMVAYREANVMPAPEDDKTELLSITKSAVKLSTDALFQELFNYYWMSATGMVAYWEFGFSFKTTPATTAQFRTNLVSNCSNPNKFYDYLHQTALDILPLYPASNAFLNLTRNLLFSELTTYRQKILYLHIKQCYKNSFLSALYSHPDHLLSQDASLLLMYMDDPDYIYQNLDMKEMKQTGTRIGSHTLMKLLQNYLHPSIPKIIFQDDFFSLLKVDGKTKEDWERQKKFKTATIIRYFLFRDCRPQELLDYLSPAKGNRLESLLEHERLPILDLLPINELRAYKDKYYDPDVFQYLDEYDDEEESVEGLHYRIYKRSEEYTYVWIRNITTPLKGLSALIASKTSEIVNDEIFISKQYRFKLTSNAIINSSGTLRVDEHIIKYDVPFAGPEIIFTTFDERIAQVLIEADSVVIGENQICTVEKTYESLPKSWRVLTLKDSLDIPYFGDMQFAKRGEYVDIDKTIREDGYRFDPQLFRNIEKRPSQNCLDTPFVLLGLSNTKVWVVTDKLMNYDRYKNANAVVRAKGHSTKCRFLEAHPFSEGFVELTFRSVIPYDFPVDGTLFYTIDNQEESVPYVFCHRMGTRAVVRIIDSVFLKSISIYEKRLSYMAGYFRIGRLSLKLDYVEIFPASDRLSIWTLQRLSNESFPHHGMLEVGENSTFKKLFQLSFTKETRRSISKFDKCDCLLSNIAEGNSLFAVDSQAEPIATGLFLTNDKYAAHLRIIESNTCHWLARASFTPELQIPKEGHLLLPDFVHDVQYKICECSGSRNTAIIYSYSKVADFADFEIMWNTAASISFVADNGDVVNTGFRGKEIIKLADEKLLIHTDIPSNCGTSLGDNDGWYLSVFCPIRNEMERGYDSVANAIKVHSIPYTKASDRAIIIRKPLTEFGNLYVSCGESSKFATIEKVILDNNVYNNNPFGIEYCTVELKNEGGKRLDIDPHGEISFFVKQSDGYTPVSVGYRRVLEVIDLKKSRDIRLNRGNSDTFNNSVYQFYPSQICDILIKELSDVDVINEDLVKFFADHSRAYMLFNENKLLNKIQTLECDKPLINLCTVSSIDKEGRINTYSWLNNDPFPSMDVIDGQIGIGDLVFVERNHKITPVPRSVIKGPVFPNVGELPITDVGNHDIVVSSNTWIQEEARVKKFKNDVLSLIAFFSQKEVTPLTVKLHDSGYRTDHYGIVVQCQELPNLEFRLCGVSEPSYDALQKGNSISVLPSKKAQISFNPYKFTPKGIIPVIDAFEQSPKRNANYYCVVSNAVTNTLIKHLRNENVVGVIYGSIMGSFINTDGTHYNDGDVVHLQLSSASKTNKGIKYYFTTTLNSGIRVGQLNLRVGDILDDIMVTNNGANNSFIEVEYRVQDSVIRGTVDNSTIPDFSSRVMNGVYSPGTRLTLRVKALMSEQNSIQFELINTEVSYPYATGVYNCLIHNNPKSVFKWRVERGYVAAWATFQAEGKEYTEEILPDEMLRVSFGKDDKNILLNLLKCGQSIPAQLEITGFSDLGDPVIRLYSYNQQRLRDLPIGVSFPARVLSVNTQKHVALWNSTELLGVGRYKTRPKVGSHVMLHPEERSKGRVFIIDNERVTYETLLPNTELFATFSWDKERIDEAVFVATEVDVSSLQPTGRHFICRHTDNTIALYWVEYLIFKNEPLKAFVERVEDGIHYVTFMPVIEYNLDGLKWSKGEEYDVSVVCYARTYLIVQHMREDGRPVIGAIEYNRIDPFFRMAPDFTRFHPGMQLRVNFIWFGKEQNAVVFAPLSKYNGVFPYGLKNNEKVSCKVYHIDERGNSYVIVQSESAVRVRIMPYFSDWSVLPSGKSVVQEGDTREYIVSLKNNFVQLGLPDVVTNNPWKECTLSVHDAYQVVIQRVDSEDVLVSINGLFGEIPFSEFREPLEDLKRMVGETVFARPSLIDLSAHTILFTLNDVEALIPKGPSTPSINVGDVITASVKGYSDENTPILIWEEQEFVVTQSIAAFLAKRPWLEQVDDNLLPVGTECKIIVSGLDEESCISSVKPCNLGTDNFFNGDETTAVVLQCTQDGVYAKTTDNPEIECYVYIPKEEIAWGRIYTASNYFPLGSQITVVKRNKTIKTHLITCSIKRLLSEPKLTLGADSRVDVVIERILPSALNVLCCGALNTQIAVEDTTWNPAYLLGKQAKLTKRFHVGDTLSAIVEEGGVDQEIRLSIRDRVNPWEFDQIVVGDEWPAFVIKILDEEHFVVRCRGLFVRVSNKLNLNVTNQTWVRIRIREVFPDEPYASAVLLELLPNHSDTITPIDAEQVPFRVGQKVRVIITQVHHHLMDGDNEDYLEFSPVSFDAMRGIINNYELAWKSEDRLVDSYRVGDELETIITGIDFRHMTMTASLREAIPDVRDSRSIANIVQDAIDNKSSNMVKEVIPVTVKRIDHQFFKDTNTSLNYVYFTYGDYSGRVTIDSLSWAAIQDPEVFFHSGRKIRVQIVGAGEYYDKSIRQQVAFLKAVMPELRVTEDNWDIINDRVGQIDSATILCISANELYVRYPEDNSSSQHFVVKMSRDQLVWESSLPLKERFKSGQIIPVLVKSISPEKHQIELDSKCLRDNPYQNTLSIIVGDICSGRIISEEADKYHLDIDIDNNNRVTCVLPFTEFPYHWHRNYEKGELVKVCITSIKLESCEIIASRKDERLLNSETRFEVDKYYWFIVVGYQKDSVILDYDGYRIYMAWGDAWLDNVSDPSDMYPIGLKCLLRIKSIDGSRISASAKYNWSPGIKRIRPGWIFKAEVCLRNPANGIIMRLVDTDDCFCFITRKNFSEPLMSDILSYIPRNKYKLAALYPKKNGKDKEDEEKKVYARFNTTSSVSLNLGEKDYEEVKPGKVVTGTVKRVTDKYVIVLYKNIQIYVDKSYIDENSTIRRDGLLTVRITHHEHYYDNKGEFVSKKLLGSAYAVINDPYRDLPIGKQVSGLVAIATTKKSEVVELRVDLPHKGTVIGKLVIPWGKSPVYRGQRIIAYVSYHNYETREVQFSLFRPDLTKLTIGSIVKATVQTLSADSCTFTADASFYGNHYPVEAHIDSLFWGKKPSTPIIKVGSRFSMAVTAINKQRPVSLTRRAMFLDYSILEGEIVRGKILAHENNGCIIMAGGTLGFMPIYEMSYQQCELWQLLFPIGESFDFMVCAEEEAYPGTLIFSHRRVYDNPFDSFNPKSLIGKKTFMGEIVRATEQKAVARLSNGIEALILNMKVFSDGFQTIIPEHGTNVHLKIAKVEIGEDGRWIIEVKVIPNSTNKQINN